jgi:hypothetical protein
MLYLFFLSHYSDLITIRKTPNLLWRLALGERCWLLMRPYPAEAAASALAGEASFIALSMIHDWEGVGKQRLGRIEITTNV